jgi:lipopolysaccharide export system protein LptC
MSLISRWAMVIFILSAIAYAVTQWRNDNDKSSNILDNDLTPDFIAESLKSAIYNEKGQLSHEIEAARMEHYSPLKLSHFESPHYTLYPTDNSSPWHVNAQEATLYNNNNVILKSKIRITTSAKDGLIQEIHGKTLELDLNTNIITSDQEIIVYGKDFTLTGSGLMIDLNTTQMTIKKHGKTIYKKPNS